MKIISYVICLCAFTMASVHAEAPDLLSEEMLLGTEQQTPSSNTVKSSTGQTVATDDDKEENSGSILGFIIKPISNLFKSEEKVTEVAEGETESPLDKSIRLANEGSLDDQMNLAYMYLYGINGVEADVGKAVKYYEMASQQNDPIALNNLGSLYFSGIGVDENRDLAVNLFNKAAELGNDNAALNLAFIYMKGGAKDPGRNKKVLSLLEQAQKAGNKIAEFMLGYAYYKGFVVEPDYNKAYKLIKSAATGKSQIDEAQLILAHLYVGGIGTVQNYNSAVSLYRSAVNQDNIEAIMTLAAVYNEGKITPQNQVLAHALYNIAAARNVPGAAQKRDEIAENMQLEMLTNAQSIAQNFKTSPSELTSYIRQTYGYNIRSYIDINMPDNKPKK